MRKKIYPIPIRQGVKPPFWQKHPMLFRRIVPITGSLAIVIAVMYVVAEPNQASHPYSLLKAGAVYMPKTQSHLTIADKPTLPDLSDDVELHQLNVALEKLQNRNSDLSSRTEKGSTSRTIWRQYIADGRFGAARYALNRHLKSHPNDIDAWALLAECQYHSKRKPASVTSFRKIAALSNGPKRRQNLFIAGIIAQEIDNNTVAAQIFKRYLREEQHPPMQAEAMIRLIHAYYKIGLKEESNELWRKSLANRQDAPLTDSGKKLFAELKTLHSHPSSQIQ